MHFFKKYGPQTDIFCLQEVYDTDQADLDRRHPDEHVRGDLFRKISRELPEFDGWFARFHDEPGRMSVAMFVRKTLPILMTNHFVIHRPEELVEVGSVIRSPRKLQYVSVPYGVNGGVRRFLLIANYHGLWTPGSKTDTPERIVQSVNVKDFLYNMDPVATILCGDFNLLPETKSLQMLADGMRNLVIESGVQSTRTVLYRHHGDPAEPPFADYMMVSPGLAVREFSVLPDIASDHAALRVVVAMPQENE